MRLVFMGTPELAAGALPAIAEKHDVVGVFTRPDAVRGRGKKLIASPVKQCALELGLDVHELTSLRTQEAHDLVESLNPDAICVIAYGAILPKEILDIPAFGCLNAHTSLLPRWRGAAPIQRAILANDECTGVSIMRMEEGLDTGPYCLQTKVAVDGKYYEELERELSAESAKGLVAALDLIERGDVSWTVQPESGVTYASKISKPELMLDPDDTALGNVARVHASSDAHPSRAVVGQRLLTVLRASSVQDEEGLQACSALQKGEAVFAAKRLFAMADDAPFEIESVKPDGKKAMDAKAFVAGLQGAKGKVLTWGRS